MLAAASVAALLVLARGDTRESATTQGSFSALWQAVRPVAERSLARSPSPPEFPSYTAPGTGRWERVDGANWNAGYLAGCYWRMFDLTRDPKWRTQARAQLAALKNAVWGARSASNLAGAVMASFGQALTLDSGASAAERSEYEAVVARARRQYAGEYSSRVKALRSWPNSRGEPDSLFKVIVDASVGLEIFWASTDAGAKAKALDHMRRVVANHVRPDGSTFHVVEYDSRSGAVTKRRTHQGYADTSTWARGQAWAMYGLAMAYEASRAPEMLQAARRVSDAYLRKLRPYADYVPRWDFDAPTTKGWKDSSAAAIAACALFRLAELTCAPEYAAAARATVESLANGYVSGKPGAGSPAPDSMLGGATYNAPDGHHDTGMILADFYFLEALQRLRAAESYAGCTPSRAPL